MICSESEYFAMISYFNPNSNMKNVSLALSFIIYTLENNQSLSPKTPILFVHIYIHISLALFDRKIAPWYIYNMIFQQMQPQYCCHLLLVIMRTKSRKNSTVFHHEKKKKLLLILLTQTRRYHENFICILSTASDPRHRGLCRLCEYLPFSSVHGSHL